MSHCKTKKVLKADSFAEWGMFSGVSLSSQLRRGMFRACPRVLTWAVFRVLQVGALEGHPDARAL